MQQRKQGKYRKQQQPQAGNDATTTAANFVLLCVRAWWYFSVDRSIEYQNLFLPSLFSVYSRPKNCSRTQHQHSRHMFSQGKALSLGVFWKSSHTFFPWRIKTKFGRKTKMSLCGTYRHCSCKRAARLLLRCCCAYILTVVTVVILVVVVAAVM